MPRQGVQLDESRHAQEIIPVVMPQELRTGYILLPFIIEKSSFMMV
jgi:hypothetical protein